MPKFRKKPVVIEAVQVKESIAILHPEIKDLLDRGTCLYTPRENCSVTIHTLKGDMVANPGDWVIKEVEGETYPCKDSVFQATYEKVED